MQMFEPEDSRCAPPLDSVLLSATDGSPALGPGGSRCTSVRDRTVPPLPVAEWVSGPPSFGPLPSRGNSRTPAVPVGRWPPVRWRPTPGTVGVVTEDCLAVPVLLGTDTAGQFCQYG